jgi:ABC-type glycerol-3-phosphate transport system substrate-binding protein
MQAKVIKLLAIVGAVIVAWVLLFLFRGESNDSQKTTTLEFWNVFDTSEEVKPLLEDFTANTGIKVNYRNFTDLEEYKQTLLLELAAGEGPDILAIHDSWISKYRNLLTPLPTELGYSPKNVEVEFVDAVKQAVVFEEEIPESDKEKGRVPKIQVLGLPMYVETLALYYNQSFFRNILSKPYAAPELTWGGVRDDSTELTVKDNLDLDGFKLSGIALGRMDNISRGLDLFYNIYKQFGGADLQNADKESKRDSKGNSYNPFTTAVEFFTGFTNPENKEYCWSGRIAADYPEKELVAFARGEVAMIGGYSYYYEEIKNLIEQLQKAGQKTILTEDVKIAPIPQLYDPRSGNPKSAVADFFALAVAKSSKNPFASWQLILSLTNRETQTKYHEATNKPTSRRDLIQVQEEDPLYGVFAEQAVFASVLPIPDDEKYNAAITQRINAVANGELSLREATSLLKQDFAVEEK